MSKGNTSTLTGRRWVFTINNYNEQEENFLKTPENFGPNIQFIIAEKEVGESGTPHIQGYIEFKSDTTRNKLVRLLGGRAYVDKAKGNRASNINYCSADEKDDPGNHLIINWHHQSIDSLVKKQMSRVAPIDPDEAAREMLQDIGDLKESEFESKYPRFYLRNYSKYKELQHVKQSNIIYEFNGELKEKNLWIWGPTGTGKSRIAHDGLPLNEIYFKNVNKWWNGYKHGTKRVIIEDYPCIASGGNALVLHMKIWADRYTFTGEIKGAHTVIAPSYNLIVTSNYSIRECFSEPTDVEAIERRFHQIYFDKDYSESVHNSYEEMCRKEFPHYFEDKKNESSNDYEDSIVED